MNNLIKGYQCPGCTCGPDENYSCYKKSSDTITCEKHSAGTDIFNQNTGLVNIMLGLPFGFNRTANNPHPIFIFEKWDDCEWFTDDCIYNVPVWFHVNESGHTLIRAYQPRKNLGFTLVIGEDVSPKLKDKSIEITKEKIDEMD